MEVIIASRTDIGRVRKNNEDAFIADAGLGLFVVCDGMGGHNAGEVASATACDLVRQEVIKAAKERERFLATGKAADAKALRRVMETALLAACKEIYRLAGTDAKLTGMGTTCTAVFLAGHQKGVLAHVGDSRLYVLRAGHVHQLSEDHTFVNELVKRGALTREQAKNHPQGNVLSRALGVDPTAHVDSMLFDIDPGDTFLLCSDGLYNYFPQTKDLAERLAHVDPKHALDLLVEGAIERGGHDNVTGIVLRMGGTPAADAQVLAAERRIAMLKRIPIFAYLSYHELVKVVALTQLAHAKAGTAIVREGDPGDELYVVLAGEVQVLKGGSPLTTLKAGAHLGEMALVDNAPRSATVVATSDVNLLAMRREEFFGVIRTEPVIATKLLWSFVQVLSGRLRETNEALQGARRELGEEGAGLEVFAETEQEG